MIVNYLPYLFGITSLLIGIFLFLRSFKIYKPKNQTAEQIAKSEEWDRKFGTVMKIVSIILILRGGYNLIFPDINRYKINSTVENNGWTKEDQEILVKNCIRDSGPEATKNPKIISDYCNCSTENLMKTITKEKYNDILSKSHEEQVKEMRPILENCLNESKVKIDSANYRNGL